MLLNEIMRSIDDERPLILDLLLDALAREEKVLINIKTRLARSTIVTLHSGKVIDIELVQNIPPSPSSLELHKHLNPHGVQVHIHYLDKIDGSTTLSFSPEELEDYKLEHVKDAIVLVNNHAAD